MADQPLSRRLADLAERRFAGLVRRLRARHAPPVEVEPLALRSTAGYKLDAWLHRPAEGAGPWPAVVLCPGIGQDASALADRRGVVDADEIARLGLVALRFDPAGRGGSWGEEDFSGPEHQDEVATMVRYLAERPDVDATRIGLVGLSFGTAMAVGAAARLDLNVAWVLDWEGPSDREIITSGGERMAPAAGHGLDDEVYWRDREPVRHVGRLRCPYVRLQAERDHAQPGEFRHARRMMRAALEGDPPWAQLNDHPRDELPDRPTWLRPGVLEANRAILRKVRTLARTLRAPES